MLNLNLAKHNKVCTNPVGCAVNQGYDRRLQFITKLIEEVTPSLPAPIFLPPANLPEPTDTMKKTKNKIQWLGTQKELAELFVELKRKGWIEKFENETIQDCFTESNSLPQYLKPATDPKTKEDTFEHLYTGYTPLFYGMKENPKRHK